jgi:selenide,water dikinase
MGGVPKTAMNLVSFPVKEMDISILRRVLQGGVDKMKEAGVVLVGGHSVEDKELKYGLSVTGLVRPDQVITKHNLHIGDRLILTKALGTGIVNTAIKAGVVSAAVVERVTRLMAALNRDAAEIMKPYPVHACTDITGFGLLGHLAEMVCGLPLGVRIFGNRLPVIAEAVEFAAMGLIPAGAYKNREFRKEMVEVFPSVDRGIQDILFDPQTSGGLLICVDGKKAADLLDELKSHAIEQAAVIGEVIPDPKGKIIVI